MKNKRTVCAIIAVLAGIIYMVHRAQDSAKSVRESVPEDRLIGVYMTEEAFDPDKKIYAAKVPETLTAQDGTPIESFDYIFKEIEGFRCFTVTKNSPRVVSDSTGEFIDEDHETYTTVSDVTCTIVTSVANDENDARTQVIKSELSCYLYAYAGRASQTAGVYCNPVYQDKEGNVYTSGGHNISVSCGEDSVGIAVTTSLDYSSSEAKPSEDSASESKTVNVSLSVISEPLNYTLMQYDASGKEIDSRVYLAEDVPAEINMLSECDHAVVTETLKNGNINRSLLDKSNPTFSYYTSINDSFALGNACRLIWP